MNITLLIVLIVEHSDCEKVVLYLPTVGATQADGRYKECNRQQQTEQCEPQINTTAAADHRHYVAQVLLGGECVCAQCTLHVTLN